MGPYRGVESNSRRTSIIIALRGTAILFLFAFFTNRIYKYDYRAKKSNTDIAITYEKETTKKDARKRKPYHLNIK